MLFRIIDIHCAGVKRVRRYHYTSARDRYLGLWHTVKTIMAASWKQVKASMIQFCKGGFAFLAVCITLCALYACAAMYL